MREAELQREIKTLVVQLDTRATTEAAVSLNSRTRICQKPEPLHADQSFSNVCEPFPFILPCLQTQMVDKLSEAHERHQQLLKEVQALRTSAAEEKVPTSDRHFCRSGHKGEGLPYAQSNFPQAALEESLLKTQGELSSATGCAAILAQVESDLSDAHKRIEELGAALEQRDAEEVTS